MRNKHGGGDYERIYLKLMKKGVMFNVYIVVTF